MNTRELEVLKQMSLTDYTNQRDLAAACGCSLGMVNRGLANLTAAGYLTADNRLTAASLQMIDECSPQRAIILAAGVGMRMVPINMEQPKALIQVKEEPLIERLIGQLHEVGVREIYVVVGFLKEQFEYLIDDFGVQLIVNPNYASYNNLYSLGLVKEKLCNAYILPCDIWCRQNPFSEKELYSWYMVKNTEDTGTEVRVNRKQELVRITRGETGNPMVGISYFTAGDADCLKDRIEKLMDDSRNTQFFWEEALYVGGKMSVSAKLVPADQIVEINTYEQLRELDSVNEQLNNDIINTVCKVLQTGSSEIREISVLKKGVTNYSFLFVCKNKKYIMRIPKAGADQIMRYGQEAMVYDVLRGKKISDDLIFIDSQKGYKISRFIESVRSCDPANENDIQNCIAFLRNFHRQNLRVDHEFDIFEKIDSIEMLWHGQRSAYQDYEKTKENVFLLRNYIDSHVEEKILCHLDPVPDNFLLYENSDGEEKIRLIDWEYAAMQDPHVDIAMFCIYALYDRTRTDHVIDIYFENQCPIETRIKIYCYVAACGLLWSNWCEYKRDQGVEFGEYSLRQYRYAKEFFRYAVEEMKKI